MSGRSILVVDDEAPLTAVLADLFEIEGYEVTTCGDVEAARECFRRNKFDLALLDIFLTDEPLGLTLARQILEESPETQVVLMTGFADELDIKDGFEFGAHACIRKPFELDDVMRVVGAALPEKAHPPQLLE